jgi:tetratricopeptide (TPR) repeat protein
MGAVYAAEHVDLEKRVALKTLYGRSAQDPVVVERFRQEARAASTIGSPYICDVTDFGQLPEGQVFFVMEFLDGRSVRQVLAEQGSLPAERVTAILRQVCKALGAAHDKGIIHLDVKPDNIMLMTEGRRGDRVKIVDFGIAGLMKVEAERKESTAPEDKVIGTPDYLPPERIRGRGYDHRSDIYSLGATAYEMLTGRCLFPDEDVTVTMTRHVVDKPTPPRVLAPERRIPAEVEAVILNMLEKNPAARPQSMAAVEAMLCEAQIAAGFQTDWDDLELPTVDETWRRKLANGMPSPRSRRLRRQAVILGLVATAGVGLALYFGVRKPTHVIEYKPVYVEVTKTDEPESVAPWLKKAVAAAEAEHFIEPAQESSLYFVEQAELEAKKLGTTSGGAQNLRRIYGNQFRSMGHDLARAGLADLAVLRYRQALRFLPGDEDLRSHANVTVASETTVGRATVAARTESGAGRAAAELFAAANRGQFSQARVQVKQLQAVDAEGEWVARLADRFRRQAGDLWDGGKRDQARLYYQLVWDLDPKDSLAHERATSRDVPIVTAPVEPVPAVEPVKVIKRKTGPAPEVEPEVDAPRNRDESFLHAKQGAAALARGDLGAAENDFNHAVRADASNPDALAGLAEVAFERARYSEALDYGRRAVRRDPKKPRYHTVVGDAFFKLLRYDEAVSAYERALALSPGDTGIKARLERVRSRLAK